MLYQMTKKTIAKTYLEYLEKGEIDKVIDLFTLGGIVDSPIYGVKSAKEFYYELKNDTKASTLVLKGIFQEKNNQNIALYFSYKWTLKSNKIVTFDVVDIIEFDAKNKIKTLKIIYDTAAARKLVHALDKN